MVNWFAIILAKTKTLLTPTRFGGSAALLIALIYFAKSKRTQPIQEVRLSYFIRALQSNVISEVIVDGFRVFFRGQNTEVWRATNASLLS